MIWFRRAWFAISVLIFSGSVLVSGGCAGGHAEERPFPLERSFEFVYKTEIKTPSDKKAPIEVWLPVPQTTAEQTVHQVTFEAPVDPEWVVDPLYGNKIAYFKLDPSRAERIAIQMSCQVTRRLVAAMEGLHNDQHEESTKLLNRFLEPDSLVPIDGKIAREAARVVRPGMSRLEKARAIYDYVVQTMVYDKSGQGWGRGDAIYACDVRKGNCTDFHSLFIGMARASGIPARFIMGFPVPSTPREGKIGGYHCWAEFYHPDYGWIPVDASEAFKHPELKDFLFGSLDPNRIQFTLGRDIPLPTRRGMRKLNYLIYPYVELAGQPYSQVSSHFAYRDLERISLQGTD